jgi:hypothetical protein
MTTPGNEDDDALSSFIGSQYPNGGPEQPPAGPVFVVGQKVEALLGKARVCTLGHVIYDNCDGSYAVWFETGHEFAAVDGEILTPIVDRVLEIETQLAQVRWRKMQNESKIKAMLESSKDLQEQDLLQQLEVDHNKEKAEWVSSCHWCRRGGGRGC